MPGAVTSLTCELAIGWASHPALDDYPVTLNVVLQSRVVRSVLVDGAPPGGGRSVAGPGWFELDLRPLRLTDATLGRLAFIVGETDERLPVPIRRPEEATLRVEDILSLNLSRAWVTGATYHDALRAGRSDADIIDLLYRDILGRSADPSGLANYLNDLDARSNGFDNIRSSLLRSDECQNRPRDVSEAPGAIFSLRLVGDAGPGPGDHVTHLLPVGTRPRSAFSAALLEPAAGGTRARRAGEEALSLPARAREFHAGWHELEGAGDSERRWMERVGAILNPWPHLPVSGVVLRVRETHLNQAPELRCFFDDAEVPWRLEGEPGSGMQVWIGPAADAAASRFSALRLECLNAGSPLEQGVNADPRMLSVAVSRAEFSYGAGALARRVRAEEGG